MKVARPALSVVIPLPETLRGAQETFASLAASDLPRRRWELIVVATTQDDDVVALAAEYGDAVVRVGDRGGHGSAYLCNRGAAVSRAPILVFLDRDILVLPGTLRHIDEAFSDPELTGLVGSIAPTPSTASVPTRYRSLVREWAHGRGAGPSEHFATYCGAIRAPAFFAAGQLDEWQRPPLGCAARELGIRLRRLGHRVELRQDVLVRSRRAASWLEAARPLMVLAPPPPWMLASSAGAAEPIRRLRRRERLLSMALWTAVFVGLASMTTSSALLGRVALSLAAGVLAIDLPLLVHTMRGGGPFVASAAVPLRLASLFAVGLWMVRDAIRFHVLGEPRPEPGVEALIEVEARVWPPTPARPRAVVAEPAPTHASESDAH